MAKKFTRHLELLELLTSNEGLRVGDICERMGIERRSVYRYLQDFRDMGFHLSHHGSRYGIERSSPFFDRVTEKIHFTDDEALTISQVLSSVYDNSPQMRHLREKLSRIYGSDVLARHGIDAHVAENLSALFRAVSQQRLCVLRGYSSPSSRRTADRVVEPYMFLAENREVRCYEPASGMNKTFKISRAERVDVLDLLWSYQDRHEAVYTDLFHFSSEQREKVSLLLGRRAASLLMEEYPFSERQMKKMGNGRYRLDTYVCSYKGVGRFVLGLMDDITVLRSPGFKSYLREQLEAMARKMKFALVPAAELPEESGNSLENKLIAE